MTTSDQAKSKLLDSMRVSKQGAKEVPAKGVPVAKKATPVSKAKTTTTKKAAKPAASKKTDSDSFQAAKRVWPD